ncbi:MAG: FG-GAP repeat domain-containing protein [Anaerolineae bacterium]
MLARLIRWVLTWGTIIALSGLGASSLLAQGGLLVTADTDDDEIVVIGQDGKVYGLVYSHELNKDPELLVGFISSDAGWTDVATGDFNGDGDHEIVAIGSTLVKVFDPGGSTTAASFTSSSGSSEAWTQVTTGDTNNDGQDEIILLRPDGSGGNVTIFSPTNSTATAWTTLENVDFLTNWRDVAVADFEGNSNDDLLLLFFQSPNNLVELREGDAPQNLLDSNQNASSLTTDQEWFDIVAGQIVAGGRAEWAATRSKADTLLAQQWTGTAISTVGSINYATPFEKLALGDVYGDGDKEVIGLRNISNDTGVQVWNPAGPQYAFVLGESIGTGWLGVAAGNVDKDSQQTSESKPYEEIILVKSNLIRIYTVAQANNTFFDFSGSYLGPVAVGNLGIEGQEPFNVSVTTITRVAAISDTIIPAENFTIRGESASQTPINWQAVVIPAYSWPSLQNAIAKDPAIELTITPNGLRYQGQLGPQSIPAVDWVKLTYSGQSASGGGAITGTTPSTVTTEFITNTSLMTVGTYNATILIDSGPDSSDRFKTIDVVANIFAQVDRQYIPILLK